MDNAGPDGAIFGTVIILQRKVVQYVEFTDQVVISLKLNDSCKKVLCMVLKYIKNCPSGVSLITHGCLAGRPDFGLKFDCP